MNITNQPNCQELIQWAQKGIELLKKNGETIFIQEIQQAISQLEQDIFLLTVLGKAKRGKSTIINALLGRSDDMVAPIDKLPASNVISRFKYGNDEEAVVLFQDGHQKYIPFECIREFVTEEENPQNQKQVEIVNIVGPFSNLENNLILVDTPGAASIHEYHNTILQGFIPQSDAIIFLVTARMPLDQDELDLLQKVKKADIQKIFFAVNKMDNTNENDLQEAILHNQSLLQKVGINIDKIYRISAKKAWMRDWEHSGVMELLNDVRNYLAVSKGFTLNTRFISRVAQSIESAMQATQMQILYHQKKETELDSEIQNFQDVRQSINQQGGYIEKEFLITWDRTIDEFGLELEPAKNDIMSIVYQHIADISLFDMERLSKEFSCWITQILETKLSPLSNRMERTLKDACSELEMFYPDVSVSKVGTISIQSKEAKNDTMTLSTLVGGAVMVTGGYSIASAGASVAASIATLSSTTTITPTLVTTLLGLLPSKIATFAASFLGKITSISVSTVATQQIPFWVAISGPLGWSLFGLGLFSIPLAWSISKTKKKEQLQTSSNEYIIQVFDHIRNERIVVLKQMGISIVEEFRTRIEHKLAQIEIAIKNAKNCKSDPMEMTRIQTISKNFQLFLKDVPAFSIQEKMLGRTKKNE